MNETIPNTPDTAHLAGESLMATHFDVRQAQGGWLLLVSCPYCTVNVWRNPDNFDVVKIYHQDGCPTRGAK